MGFHIPGFDMLFESMEDENEILTDHQANLDFLKTIHNLTLKYSEKDMLDR